MNKIFECSGLLDGLEDKEVSGKLSAAISDAIELAEDYAFDAGAELQSAISADELTSHEDGAEAHADTNTSTSEDTPNTIEYVQDAREFIEADVMPPHLAVSVRTHPQKWGHLHRWVHPLPGICRAGHRIVIVLSARPGKGS